MIIRLESYGEEDTEIVADIFTKIEFIPSDDCWIWADVRWLDTDNKERGIARDCNKVVIE